MQKVLIPSSLTFIGKDAFSECPKLAPIENLQTTASQNAYQKQLTNLNLPGSCQEETPSEIIDKFVSLNGKKLDTHSLLTEIHDITCEHDCQYVSWSTGDSRQSQTFKCKEYKGTFQCKAFVRYFIDYTSKKIILDAMYNTHSHRIGQGSRSKSRNTLTTYQKERIKELTQIGLTAGRIRINESLCCSPYVLYGARRQIIKEMRANEMPLMIKEMHNWPNWSHIVFSDKNGRFNYLYSFHEPVMNSNYANSLCVVDDTSCTNAFGFALFVMLSIDENYNDQILCFSLMSKKTTKSFMNFLKEVKIRLGNINVFLSDRCPAQIEALKNVWPESQIIFCAVHIGRNIKSEVNDEIFQYYMKMRNHIISEEELIQKFKQFINEHSGDDNFKKAVNLLSKLLKELDHWLPSIIDNYEHYDADTTNRIEGLFGNLKEMSDHSILTVQNLIKSVFILAKRFQLKKSKEAQISINTDILSLDDQSKLSNVALLKVLNEFNEADIEDEIIDYSENCCATNVVFGIPCKHLINKRKFENHKPLLTIDDFSPRWLHGLDYNVQIKVESTISRKTDVESDDIDYSYSALSGEFEKYFSAAFKCQEIQFILKDALNLLKRVEIKSNSNSYLQAPNTLPIPGAPKTRPKNNVDHICYKKKK